MEDRIWWKKDFKKFDPAKYEGLRERVVEHLNRKQASLYVKDVFCGWDPSYAVPYRFVGEYATHAFFAHNMFPKDVQGVADPEGKRWTMLNVPSFRCDPDRDGTLSERAAILDFKHRIALVVGRADYCGVVKKSMFTVMNFLLPERSEMSAHCSANVGARGDCAILFGLSGTGKTTLSADPDRKLIGDDEHAWTKDGVSNYEDGCYAKLIDLDKQDEPIIAAALSMAGTLIENVPPLPGRKMEELDPQELDLTDRSITENTRFSYPLACNPNVAEGARGPHPETIVLLTADAFGVLPPVSILSGKDVMYHFVQGFTAKLAGTEVGITEPQAAFSACFGAPFMSQKPSRYAELLAGKMEQHHARCVLLNTGWSGGPYGVGKRISIGHTRALLNAALNGDLDEGKVEFTTHPIFNLRMPKSCPGVPSSILDPRETGRTGRPTTPRRRSSWPCSARTSRARLRGAGHRARDVMSSAAEHYKLGLARYGEQKFVEAIEEYRQALELQPEWSDCLQALGMAQMHAGQLDEALATLIRVTELAPDDPLAFTSLSMAYQRKDRIDDAEKAQATARMLSWKQELKTNPDAPPPANDGMHVQQ